MAIDADSPEIASIAINAGFPVEARFYDNLVTPLMLSAEDGRVNMIRYLHSVGSSLETVDNAGYNALHYACGPSGKSSGVDACLGLEGVNLTAVIEAKEAQQLNTPLHFAAVNGHFDSVKALIEAGANIEAKNKIGNTPFMVACFSGNVEIVQYLLSKNADYLEINANDHDGLALASRKKTTSK